MNVADMAQNTLQGLRLEDTDALFIDFDGTLAEIGPDPAAIRLAPGMEPVLLALCGTSDLTRG